MPVLISQQEQRRRHQQQQRYYQRNEITTTTRMKSSFLLLSNDDDDDDDTNIDIEEDDVDDEDVVSDYVDTDLNDDDDDFDNLDLTSLNKLTIPQLKQQLRLRGLKISGKKQDLISRLLPVNAADDDDNNSNKEGSSSKTTESSSTTTENMAEEKLPMPETESKAQKFAKEAGKDFIDVEAYLDDDEKGKDVKTLSNPEVWGSEAKIVDDYEGRSPVVDGLSRTVIEFRGSNQTNVQAYVVASRDAMKPFLEGGKNRTITNSDPMRRLQEIQLKREVSEKRPVRMDDDQGLDEGDENGIYKEALHREFSDWGEYTVTGAQLSADEVQGVLILSDVYGPFTEATKALAEKIAFECQPVVCMVPDLFRENPWREDGTTPGFNEQGQDYEEWRAMHCDELRVSVDIRAAGTILREQYGVSSIVVWGTCFGGGRALEIAAGYLPGGKIMDVDGMIGPLPVMPEVVVAWYPTRYNAKLLFGPDRSKMLDICEPEGRNFAVMGIFAGKDTLDGATPNDVEQLKSLLEKDNRIKDHMIKSFPDQDHGFAHNVLGRDHDESELDRFVDDEFGGSGRVTINDGDADVACLLSTAFMETYSRKFLPTTGAPISTDEEELEWNAKLNMKDFSSMPPSRDVKAEIKESLDNHKDLPLEGRYIDPGDESQQDDLFDALRTMQDPNGSPELQIADDDNLETAYAKLLAGDENFQIF
jgi:dienelactone hydrolase